ncbi:hypothetical protein F5887DRAFT_609045 [Amanita rubescens]|nr:hypothetical protein F5887DRAFT_609045 [Amanita rubescens]
MGSLELTTERAKLAPVKGSDSTDDPFRNLPNELLSRIFVLCCNSPLRVLDVRLEVPHQQTISQVCSRWRQVALSTGVLWSNVHVEKFHANHPYYPHSLRVYQMWVGRAGDYPLTISIYYSSSHPGFRKVFLDFIVPIRIKKLDIRLPFLRLVNLPSLSVEEFTIADIVFLQADEDLKASQFMKKTRRIHIRSLLTPPEECEPELKELFLSWHQLRSFECDSRSVSLSAWLNVLGQSGTVQYLEWCHLTIANAGSGPLVGVCMPNLHWLSLKLLDVQPDIVIPLITVPNITTLEISFQNDWESSDAYDVIKRHYNLRQLHQIRFWGAGFPVRIAQILADAPMIHTLGLQCEPILDTEAREGIASGRLGRCLTTLYMNTGLRAGEWLDMIETRQKNVKSMVMKASNWQEIFTGIKSVEIWDSPWSADCDYQERVTTLNALGTTLEFVHQPIPWSYT